MHERSSQVAPYFSPLLSPTAEPTLYWATPGDAALRPAFQGRVGHDPETGVYDNGGSAESWEHNDEFTQGTHTLHEAAEFHDDSGPVTAEDVVQSFALHAGPDTHIIGVSHLQAATATGHFRLVSATVGQSMISRQLKTTGPVGMC